MSQDRFVKLRDTPPTVAELQWLLEDFFAGAAESIHWGGDRFFVNLGGQCSDPLRRLGRDRYAPEPFLRWLEVWCSREDPKTISVITRHGDEYVSALADGIARLLALRWNGTEEPR